MLAFNICLIASLASVLTSQSINTASCGQRPLGSSKIVGGVKAIPGDWSWSISLSSSGRHFCGGVLITNQYVLTAAHCFQTTLTPTYISTLTVDIGVHDRLLKEPWVKTFRVSKVFKHESFSLQTLQNDIAILKLATPVTFDDKYYIPACVPDVDDLNFDSQNKTVWLTGWGSTYFGGALTREKLQVSMQVLSNARCSQKYLNMFDPARQICAGELGLNNGACQGDSGGPFVRLMDDGKWYVIGLISWGYDCGKGTVFTKVTSFLPWINSKIALN